MAPPTEMITVDNLSLELLDLTQVTTWWGPILQGHALLVLTLADMVLINLLGVARHVAHATEHGTTGPLILHHALSGMSLIVYSNVTANFLRSANYLLTAEFLEVTLHSGWHCSGIRSTSRKRP